MNIPLEEWIFAIGNPSTGQQEIAVSGLAQSVGTATAAST